MKKIFFSVLFSIAFCSGLNTIFAATVDNGEPCGNKTIGECIESDGWLCPDDTSWVGVLSGGDSCKSGSYCCKSTTIIPTRKRSLEQQNLINLSSKITKQEDLIKKLEEKVENASGDRATTEALEELKTAKSKLATLTGNTVSTTRPTATQGTATAITTPTKTGPVFSGPGMKAGAATLKTSLGSGISKVEGLPALISAWTKFLLPILAVLAVAAIVWAGFLYVTSAVDDGNIEKAKKIVMYVIVGLILVLSANVIVKTFSGGAGAPDSSFIVDWIVGWTRFLLPIMAVLAVAAVVWAGFLYVTSAVDDGNVDKAKKIIMYVVIGIFVTLSAYALVNTVLSSLF